MNTVKPGQSAKIPIERYDYDLPKELIAQHPLANRGDSRMLIVDRAANDFQHAHVRDLASYLKPADCLVLNESRVIPARLVGYRVDTGGRWQGLVLESDERGVLRLICKTRSPLKPGTQIMLVDRETRDALLLTMIARLDDGQWAAGTETDEPTGEMLERVGRVPLPHYIRGGEMVDADLESYQTVYATRPGSVAAPTAGLHLTRELLNELERQGVSIARVTLHIGIGTFRLIGTGDVAQHKMHSEKGSIDEANVRMIRQSRQRGGRVVAVGTTTVRLLETAASSGELTAWQGESNLFIHPPFQFHAVDSLMTNFHLPRSSLLVLVRAFGGETLIKRAYDEAIEQRYRFFSYGDAMLIV